jgi:hypothetical protein
VVSASSLFICLLLASISKFDLGAFLTWSEGQKVWWRLVLPKRVRVLEVVVEVT